MVRGRQSQKRSLKKIIYIFTEGETEKNYFNMLNKKYRTSATVKVNISSGRKQGLALLNFALNKLQSLSESERKEIDKIYIVFDKDDISVDEMKTILKKLNQTVMR
ncbi:RloB family protein [Enterococcus cecorum]